MLVFSANYNKYDSMRKRITFLLLAALSILWIARRQFQYSGASILDGSALSLVDHVQSSFITKSCLIQHLRSITNAEINSEWRKLILSDSASIWVASAHHFIVDGPKKTLTCSGTEVKAESNIFQERVEPGRWSSFEDQVFLTVAKDVNPNSERCYLNYQTFAETRETGVDSVDLEKSNVFHLSDKTQKLAVLALGNSIFHADSSETILRRNGDVVARAEWYYAIGPPVLLVQSVLGEFKMFSSSDVLKKEVLLPAGLIQVEMTATGDMAGDEPPRVGVYVDDRKEGEIKIMKAEKSHYTMLVPMGAGKHTWKFVFENDFYDQQTKQDRNVGIQKVQLEYLPALIVNEPGSGNAFHYRVTFKKSDSPFYDWCSSFVIERSKAHQMLNPVSFGVAIQDELRRSLVLGSEDKIDFPILVPKSGALQFGYAFRSNKPDGSAHLKITLHRAFHFPVTLLSENIKNGSQWTERSLNLDRFAEQNIHLSFENATLEDTPPSLIFLSNPRIVSPRNKSRIILLFSFDALRADHLGAYGYRRPTSPHIDAFAQSNVLFENTYTAATWTLPSFESLFTSLSPSFHGVKGIRQTLDPSLPTLAQLLHAGGYFCGAFIDNPLLHPLYGLSKGFDSYNFDTTAGNARIRSSSEWLKRSNSEKLFLFVHLMNPHSPYTAPKDYDLQVAPETKGYFDPAAYSRLLSRTNCSNVNPKDLSDVELQYDAEIRQGDDLFQVLLDQLKKLSLYDSAMIIVMSDHGEEFLDHGVLWHGQNVFQSTARVPLIIKFPSGMNLHGLKVYRRVHLTDLMPTILSVARIRAPEGLQGSSLLSQLQSPNVDRFLFVENRSGILGIFHTHYKYIFKESNSWLDSCPPGSQEHLYDLAEDPAEKTDLFQQQPDLVEMFRRQKSIYQERAVRFQKSKLDKSRAVEPDSNLIEQMRALGYVQ